MMIGRVLGAGGTEVSPLFGLLTLVLVGVVVVSLVLLRFRQSLLVGYFLCGVILANSGVLGWIGASSDDFGVLAELGIILLLFTIGLEFSAPPPSPPDRRPGTQGLEKRFTSNKISSTVCSVSRMHFPLISETSQQRSCNGGSTNCASRLVLGTISEVILSLSSRLHEHRAISRKTPIPLQTNSRRLENKEAPLRSSLPVRCESY